MRPMKPAGPPPIRPFPLPRQPGDDALESVRAHAAARATQPPDVAWDWVRSVESLDADDVPAPVPVDELSVMIREDGELAETPALALLDEIQRLRTALAARDAVAALKRGEK